MPHHFCYTNFASPETLAALQKTSAETNALDRGKSVPETPRSYPVVEKESPSGVSDSTWDVWIASQILDSAAALRKTISINGALFNFANFGASLYSRCFQHVNLSANFTDKKSSKCRKNWKSNRRNTKNFSVLLYMFLTMTSVLGSQAFGSTQEKCEPYFDGNHHYSKCEIAEKFLDKEEELLINRPNTPSGCEKCVQKVTAHEANHHVQLEFKTIAIQESSRDKFKQCHTCLCGVLAVYDGSFLIGEWCYGRFTSKYLTSNGRTLTFVYRTEKDTTKPNATFHLVVKPVPQRTTEIISVDEGFSGLQSGHLISSDQFPAGSYTEGPRGMRLWMFVNNRPGTTLRLKFNDMYLKPPQMVGFCPTAFINIFHGPPQLSDTWYSVLCDRNFPEDIYFTGRIVTVAFLSISSGSVADYGNGFNISYTFFNRNVTGHKHLDCGEFNNTNAFGQGFRLPPGGSESVEKKSKDASSTEVALKESAPGPSGHSSTRMNADLRCHWRIVGPPDYDKFMVTITSFQINPLSNTGETMQELESDDPPKRGTPGWSISLKEPVGLKLFDGMFSSSPVLTEHLVTDPVQPGNRPQFYLTSKPKVRIDVSYPTQTLGTIGFGYAAIRLLDPQSEDTCHAYNEFKCSGVTIGDKAYGDNPVKFAVGDYCIHRQLVCDGVPNCIKGEDEEEKGVSKCGSESDRDGSHIRQLIEYATVPEIRKGRSLECDNRMKWQPENVPAEGLGGLTVALIVVVVVLGIAMTLFAVLFMVKKLRSSSGGGCPGSRGSSRNADQDSNVLSSTNPATNSSTFSSQGHQNGHVNAGQRHSSSSSAGGRNSRHSSGDNSGGVHQSNNPIVEHDPHVTPQPIYIATRYTQPGPPPYDMLGYHSNRLPSVDEENEADFGATDTTDAHDRLFLLRYDSGKNDSSLS